MEQLSTKRGHLETAFDGSLLRAEKRIVILGINPLSPYLEESARLFADLLLSNEGLQIVIYYESESELFATSLLNPLLEPDDRMNYTYLDTHRQRVIGGRDGHLFVAMVEKQLSGDVKDPSIYTQRVNLQQVHVRMPICAIQVDDKLFATVITSRMPTINEYEQIAPGSSFHDQTVNLLNFLEGYGSKFLSAPGDELIEMYDNRGIPRGIFPRKCFYTTEYQRASVWGFVFNRKGQVLFHQRSKTTKDNRLLWDKSFGGHIDVKDTSSSITAKRELVEELFLPEAEFTKYTRAEIGDFIDFGAWIPEKRPEHSLRGAFEALGKSDWVMFRATDAEGEPLTIVRTSKRRITEGDAVKVRPTVFRSDVYFFIAPEGLLDSDEQLKLLVALAEERGAAADHKLESVAGLRRWINQCNVDGTTDETFTDDLLAIDLEYSHLLEGFSEFVKFAFSRSSGD